MIKGEVQGLLKQARIAKETEKADLYRTILGEMDRISKTPSKAEQEKAIRKMIKSETQCGNTWTVTILETFLPKMMSEAEIYGALDKIESTITDPTGKGGIPFFMKNWKANPELNGAADMKTVQKVIRESFL